MGIGEDPPTVDQEMIVSARLAQTSDLPELVTMYRDLEAEMTELSDMWPLADGLAEPVDRSLARELETSSVIIGEIDSVPLGFLIARTESLFPQAQGMRVGSIRFVFVDTEARQVGVGESMRELALSVLRDQGISRFDAHVLPGHRLVKNFFEQGGFAARSIVMHRSE